MIHEMRLNNEPFNKIKEGTKTVELRLLDEKRKALRVGDKIIFTNRANNEKIDVFSFGTIVWELFMRKVPYVGCDANEIKNKVGFDSKMQNQRDNIDGNVEEKDWKEGYQIIKSNPVALLFTKNDSKESDIKKILKLVLGNTLKTEVEKRLNLKRSDDDGSNATFNLMKSGYTVTPSCSYA